MFRICQARSGSFYVQQNLGSTWHDDWTRVSPFYASKDGARIFVRQRLGRITSPRPAKPTPRVVEYYGW